jgi:hypothetical protein
MSYTVLLILSFHLIVLPSNLFQTTELENRGYVLQTEHLHKHTCAQSAPVLLVLQDQTATAEKEKSAPSEMETTATGKKKDTSPQQSNKKAPSKGFVPSEKIKADKAVDFPADI